LIRITYRGGGRHAAIVKGWQVKPHHRDPVTAGRVRAAGREQPRLPSHEVTDGRPVPPISTGFEIA
jgi:hypothetical protein